MFSVPDFAAPLDLEERLAAVPQGCAVKGMYLQSLVDDMRAAGGLPDDAPHFVAYKNYPMGEWLRMLARAASALHPRLPVREGIRRLGHKGYQTYATSFAGRILIDMAGLDFGTAIRVIPTIYRLTSAGSCAIEIDRPARTCIGRLRGLWDWPDCWHVGLFEGGLLAFGQVGRVRVRSHSMCDADLEMRW